MKSFSRVIAPLQLCYTLLPSYILPTYLHTYLQHVHVLLKKIAIKILNNFYTLIAHVTSFSTILFSGLFMHIAKLHTPLSFNTTYGGRYHSQRKLGSF